MTIDLHELLTETMTENVMLSVHEQKRERARVREAKYRATYPDRCKESQQRYRAAYPDRVSARIGRWKSANREALAKAAAKRSLQIIKATPIWADLEKIDLIYSLAQGLSAYTTTEHHVDHIVPLQSDLVCGLHVECNLRVIPAELNQQKSNKLLEI